MKFPLQFCSGYFLLSLYFIQPSPCVVPETSVKVTPNSPSQDYTHPDDHNLRTYDMTPGFKPFRIIQLMPVQLVWLVSDVNAAGVASLFILLYKSFHCRISFKLWQNTAKFVKRIVASKFSKGK